MTAVRWGGIGLIYTSSKDRTTKAWKATNGVLCRTFTGHGHWVNNIALNTDYVLRMGPFHPISPEGGRLEMNSNQEGRFVEIIKYCNGK